MISKVDEPPESQGWSYDLPSYFPDDFAQWAELEYQISKHPYAEQAYLWWVVKRLSVQSQALISTNARLKCYLNKTVMQVSNDDIFREKGYVRHDDGSLREYDVPPKGQAADPARAAEESRRRAKSKVRDIALCNKFDYMLTWTLDPKQVDRTDPAAVYKRVRSALTYFSQEKDFRYIIIPEYHGLKPGETKRGIHFHGLCRLGDVQIVQSMKRGRPRRDKHGRLVYNMVDWRLGWSTVVLLDNDYEKAVNYICKYISKQDEKILGKYYLSSRDLKKAPDIVTLDHYPYDEFKDDEKLKKHIQSENNVYRDVKVLSEEFDYVPVGYLGRE